MASELSEQIMVVRRLKKAGILFCSVPNGGKRNRQEAILLKSSGVEPGVPDLLIFDSPPTKPGCPGVALEMKREGLTRSSVSKHQRRWLAALEERGWCCIVAYGGEHALSELKLLGYEV